MSQSPPSRADIEAELQRTAFQRKAVSYRDLPATADQAIEFFTSRGYKAGRTGRPNQVFVRGRREGILPAVHAELLIQTNVGRGKVTMVTISGAGEKLSEVLGEYVDALRAEGRERREQR
ncbi:MAG: hypothetical protein R3A46_05135 [Thermomicrobiales bacterium]